MVLGHVVSLDNSLLKVIFNQILVQNNFVAPSQLYSEPLIIFVVTIAGVLIPLFIADKFGKLPILKYFCS